MQHKDRKVLPNNIIHNNANSVDEQENNVGLRAGVLGSAWAAGGTSGVTALTLSQCAPVLGPSSIVASSALAGVGVGLFGLGLTFFCCYKSSDSQNMAQEIDSAQAPLIMNK